MPSCLCRERFAQFYWLQQLLVSVFISNNCNELCLLLGNQGVSGIKFLNFLLEFFDLKCHVISGHLYFSHTKKNYVYVFTRVWICMCMCIPIYQEFLNPVYDWK